MTYRMPFEERIRAAISDAYYETRNEGRTMEAAADRATEAVLAIIDEASQDTAESEASA